MNSGVCICAHMVDEYFLVFVNFSNYYYFLHKNGVHCLCFE